MPKASFDAIGTDWEIETDRPLGKALFAKIMARVAHYDAIWSRFRSDSLIGQIASAFAGGSYNFPSEAVPLFELFDRLHALSEGAVDPLVGRDLERLGYDRFYRLQPTGAGADKGAPRLAWHRDVIRTGSLLSVQQPLTIDVGAAGKGQLVDIVFGMIRDAGFGEVLVDGGGDMRHAGREMEIGLEHPFEPGHAIGIVPLANRALCASAINRRAWGEGLHHVIDGRTGRPGSGIVATWTIADDALIADGMATALFFADPQRLVDDTGFSWLRMYENGTVDMSPDFPGTLFFHQPRKASA